MCNFSILRMKKLGCTSAIKKKFLFVLHSILCNFVAEIKKIAMNGIVKTIVSFIIFMFSISVGAQNRTLMEGVDFGMPIANALTAIQRIYGEPAKKSDTSVVYTKKAFSGMDFDAVEFGFKENKLVDARFIMNSATRAESEKKMDSIAAKMKKYGISKDKEDQGPWFYVGGISPRGIGHLFTIFMYRKLGNHCAELRFGPFNPAHLE